MRRRIAASASRTSTKPRTSVSGNRSAASTGGMTAFSAAAIAATSKRPPEAVDARRPATTPPATISATPVASHDASRPNTVNRGRSGFQAVDAP